MNLKYVVEIVMILIMCMSNYMIMTEYYDEYVPEYYTREKILQKNYRCFRFFHENSDKKYIYNSCKPYLHEYEVYKLERSRYIYTYHLHNILMTTVIVIYHLVI
jgi:hypothetical protein